MSPIIMIIFVCHNGQHNKINSLMRLKHWWLGLTKPNPPGSQFFRQPALPLLHRELGRYWEAAGLCCCIANVEICETTAKVKKRLVWGISIQDVILSLSSWSSLIVFLKWLCWWSHSMGQSFISSVYAGLKNSSWNSSYYIPWLRSTFFSLTWCCCCQIWATEIISYAI